MASEGDVGCGGPSICSRLVFVKAEYCDFVIMQWETVEIHKSLEGGIKVGTFRTRDTEGSFSGMCTR